MSTTKSAAQAVVAPAGVWRDHEFRGLALAQFTSECGDQIAAIAISLLVYGRSNSPLLAAASYAVTYVPWILGSILLSPLADRYPRRAVMLVCDAARALLVVVLTLASLLEGIPVGVLIGLVLISSFFSPPFSAARGATIPDIFVSGPRYVRALAIGRILQQLDQVAGFAVGGVIVAIVHPAGALAFDAATFAVSFLLIAAHVRSRPPASPGPHPPLRPASMMRQVRPDLAIVWRHPTRRALLLFSAMVLIFVISPDALAVPYARQHGHGAVAAGALAAAQPFGVAVGAWLFVKYVPVRFQGRWLIPLSAMSAVALALTATVPPIWLACALWAVSGMGQAVIVATIAAYNVVTDRSQRARANGFAAATIAVTQGIGFVIWGGLAEHAGAAAGVAWAGVTGLLILAVIRYLWPDDIIDDAWAKLAKVQS